MKHSFEVGVAVELGVMPAILLDYFAYWTKTNEENETNFHDGHYWTYNSRKAFQGIFPYMGEWQIREAIKALMDAGLLISGVYNKSPFDRTAWYTLTEKGKEASHYDSKSTGMKQPRRTGGNITIRSGGNLTIDKDETYPPIPVINNTVNNTVSRQTVSRPIDNPSLTPPTGENKKDLTDSGFEDFWTAYPRKKSKEDARKAWAKLKPDEGLQAVILQAVSRQKRSDQWQNPQYIPYPAHWLRAHGWEDEPDAQAAVPTQERQNENLFAELLKEMQQT